MGAVLLVGCLLVAFGAPCSIFLLLVAPDPLRVILFILGAFVWLVSLFCSALLWFAVYPLRDVLAFSIFFTVTFQELLRFAYFHLLKLAQRGLEKVSSSGLHISGVHSLKDARHTTALVCGLGWSVMAGLFAVVNVAADSSGAGVPGLRLSLADVIDNNTERTTHADGVRFKEGFFLYCSLCVAALTLLQALWTVLGWDAWHDVYYERRRTRTECNADGQHLVQASVHTFKWYKPAIQLAVVYVCHYFLAYLSLVNRVSAEWQWTYLVVLYVFLVHTLVWTYFTCGGSLSRVLLAAKRTPQHCLQAVRRRRRGDAGGAAAASPSDTDASRGHRNANTAAGSSRPNANDDDQRADVRKRRSPPVGNAAADR